MLLPKFRLRQGRCRLLPALNAFMHFVNRFVNSVMPLPDVTALSDDNQSKASNVAPSAAVAEIPKPQLKPKSAASKKAPQAPKVKKVPAANVPLKRPAAAMDSETMKRPAASETAPKRAYKSMYKNGVWGIKFGGREVVRAARTQIMCRACVCIYIYIYYFSMLGRAPPLAALLGQAYGWCSGGKVG